MNSDVDLHYSNEWSKWVEEKVDRMTKYVWGPMLNLAKEANPDASKIAFVGCGTVHEILLASQMFENARLVGIDHNQELLKQAKQRCSEIADIKVGNATCLEQQFSAVDIICAAAVPHLLNDLDFKKFLQSAHNKLRTNRGFLIVSLDHPQRMLCELSDKPELQGKKLNEERGLAVDTSWGEAKEISFLRHPNWYCKKFKEHGFNLEEPKPNFFKDGSCAYLQFVAQAV